MLNLEMVTANSRVATMPGVPVLCLVTLEDVIVSLCFKYLNVMAGKTEIQNIIGATIQLLWELWMCSKERNKAKVTDFEQANTVTVKRGGNTEEEKHQ